MNTMRMRGAVAKALVLGSMLGMPVGGTVADPQGASAEPTSVQVHFGMCDASAAVPIGKDHFLVANDEDNLLRLYRASASGGAVRTYDLSTFLQVDRKHRETDIEGCARSGDLVYWITSHGRDATGKAREGRGRFFATRLRGEGPDLEVAPEGIPYKDLLTDLVRHPPLAPYDLAAAVQKAPKTKGGFNLEGLATRREGGLWLGLRNPVPGGKALVIPLLNPSDVIQGKSPQLGFPLELDLDRRGIRDLLATEAGIWIIAGPHDSKDRYDLYRWSGTDTTAQKVATRRLAAFTPEALIAYPPGASGRLQLLSDDGGVEVDGCECKRLKEPQQRRFRSFWLELAPSPER